MATRRWVGNAPAKAQINTITPANVGIGNTFTVTINAKAITFTATAGTVANVTAGLTALLRASEWGEFTEITWTDSTTHITATANTAGKPFTQTSSATGGTATNTTATTTASSGPNDLNLAANWSGTTLPTTGDDVIFDNSDIDVLYNLSALSAETMLTVLVDRTFRGRIGLPEINEDGDEYVEYRAQYLTWGATTQTVNTAGPRCKISNAAVQTALTIDSEGQSEDELPCILWKGTHASNVVTVLRGDVGVAFYGGESAVIATLTIGFQDSQTSDATVYVGTPTTLTTVTMHGGDVTINSAATTVTKRAGTLTIRGTGAYTTITSHDGTTKYQSSGTVTTFNIASLVEFLAGVGRTITNSNGFPGGKVVDKGRSVTWTNATVLATGCSLADYDLTEAGEGVSVKIS